MSELVSQPSAAPTRKVTAAMLAGATATLAAWAINEFTGRTVPPGAESAIATLLMAGAAYFTKERA